MTEHRRDSDAPKADRAYAKWQKGLSVGLANIDAYADTIQEQKPTLTSFLVKCDPDDEQGVLIVAKGYLGPDWFVAFHRADTVSAAVSELGNRLRNGSLKWREETPYESK